VDIPPASAIERCRAIPKEVEAAHETLPLFERSKPSSIFGAVCLELRDAPERVPRHVDDLIVEPSCQSLRLEQIIARAGKGDFDAGSILAPFGAGFADADEVVRLSVSLHDFSILSSSEPELRLAD
jgi:hypothetical protein